MVKLIDAISKEQKQLMRRHRIENCPYPKSCYPVCCRLGANLAGVCSGIIHKSDNLDCIRLCAFYEDLDSHEVKYMAYFMTPDEALSQINALSCAVKALLEFSSHYQMMDKELDEARNNGDKTPSNINV